MKKVIKKEVKKVVGNECVSNRKKKVEKKWSKGVPQEMKNLR